MALEFARLSFLAQAWIRCKNGLCNRRFIEQSTRGHANRVKLASLGRGCRLNNIPYIASNYSKCVWLVSVKSAPAPATSPRRRTNSSPCYKISKISDAKTRPPCCRHAQELSAPFYIPLLLSWSYVCSYIAVTKNIHVVPMSFLCFPKRETMVCIFSCVMLCWNESIANYQKSKRIRRHHKVSNPHLIFEMPRHARQKRQRRVSS